MEKDKKSTSNWFQKHKILTTLGIIVLLFVVIGAMNPKSNNETSNSVDTSDNEENDESVVESKPSLQETYDKLQKDMTKAEAEQIIGKESDSCSVTEAEYVGKMEACTYGGGLFEEGLILVNYHNDKLDTKTISKY